MTMQSLNQIAERINNHDLPQLPPERKPITISERDAEIVNAAFDRLKVIFPAWQRAFPTPESLKAARSEWTKALVEADCVSDQQLAHGFRVAREQNIPFFPSPGMFVKWCQPTPETLGMPTIEQALHEISRHRASHPAVVIAARATRFERETLSASEYALVFERAYQMIVNRVLRGEDLNVEILKGLPSKDKIIEPWSNYQERGKVGAKNLRSLFKRDKE